MSDAHKPGVCEVLEGTGAFLLLTHTRLVHLYGGIYMT